MVELNLTAKLQNYFVISKFFVLNFHFIFDLFPPSSTYSCVSIFQFFNFSIFTLPLRHEC